MTASMYVNPTRRFLKYGTHLTLSLLVPQSSISRLAILLLLFDVYLTWARVEKQTDPKTSNELSSLAQQSIVYQYMFFRTS